MVNSHSLDDPAAIGIESRVRQAIDRYYTLLVPLLAESYGRESVQQAWRQFMPGNDTPFTGDNTHGEIFFSWLFHCWSPHGIAPTRAFLDRHSPDLDPLLREYLEACLATPCSFYQITECRPGTGLRARDVLDGRHIEIFDAVASNSLRAQEIIFARVPSVSGICMMDAIAPVSFPPSFHGHFNRSRLGSASGARSEPALRKLYFDLLELHVGAQLPEIRANSGELIDGPAAYLCVDASTHTSEVTICGPGRKRGE